MSRSLNRAMLIGNLGADPEVRATGNGSRVANFSLATGRVWKDAAGTPHERTEWHRIVVWGPRVDVVERYLRKGDRVHVEGEIQYRSYEDGEGVTKHLTEINVRELILLGGREDSGAPGAPAAAAPPRAKPRTQSRPVAPAAAAKAGAFADDDLPF